jgi:hypothetical protein
MIANRSMTANSDGEHGMMFDRVEGRVLFDAMGQAYGAARPGDA